MSTENPISYFTDEAGVRYSQMDWMDLPDPEDLAALNECAFVGFVMFMEEEYAKIGYCNNLAAASGNGYVSPTSLRKEEAIESWLDRAQDYVPEWFDYKSWHKEPFPGE